jgi:putative FmdB family regulatory protein
LFAVAGIIDEDTDRNPIMPIYEYICEDCQKHFEKIVLNKQQEIACPKCGGKRNAIQLSVFSSANGTSNGDSTKSSGGFSGGGSCCGGGCSCH